MANLHNPAFIKKLRKQFLQWRTALWLRLQSLWLAIYKKNKYAQTIDEHIQQYIHQPHTTLSFLKALIHNPGATGAILPSSKYLANAMAAYIPLVENSFVVELGAGTGSITKAMLDRGIAAKRIIAIDFKEDLIYMRI